MPSLRKCSVNFMNGITTVSYTHLKNISMDEPYAAICGISEDEICLQMKDDLGGKEDYPKYIQMIREKKLML